MGSKTFGLQGPRDLLRKFELDTAFFCSLKTVETDLAAFAAFNCVIDAWSLADWCFHWLDGQGRHEFGEDESSVKERLKKDILGLHICAQLANGSKHFKLTRKNDPTIAARVSAAPVKAVAGEMRAGDPLQFNHCIAKIDTQDGVLRGHEFFPLMVHQWATFLDRHRIDVRTL